MVVSKHQEKHKYLCSTNHKLELYSESSSLLCKSCLYIKLISNSINKSMILIILFSMTCLLSTTKTRQFQINEYMQPTYQQFSAAYQAYPPVHHSNNRLLLQQQPSYDYNYPIYKPQVLTRLHRNVQHRHNPPLPPISHQTTSSDENNSRNKLLNLKFDGAESSPSSLNSMLRNINQQLVLAENYNSGLPTTSAATAATMAVVNGAAENPATAAAMIGPNLIDSLDVDDHGGSIGDHFDYSYQSRDQPQFTAISAINNNDNSTLALYHLLNLIDQSVPTISMPFQNSKTSLGIPSTVNFDNINYSNSYNNKSNYMTNNNNNINNRHQTLASQTSSSSIPNYWSRKRNQMYWRQAHQLGADLSGGGGGGGGGSVTVKQHSPLVDNAIEVQPAALKMIKTSSYLNTPSSSLTSRRTNNSQHHNYYQNNQYHHHHGHGHNLSSQNNGNNLNYPNNPSNNNNNNQNLNSMKNDDIGFGNKQQSNYSEKLNGALTSSSLSNSKVPHDADSEMIAANNAPRCDKFTPDICVDDFEYPEQAIIDEIQKKRDVFELMYSEVKDNEPLVDGIPRDVEESYNYDYYYYGKNNLSQAASQSAPTSSSGSSSSLAGSGTPIGAGLRLTPPLTAYLSKNQRSPSSSVSSSSSNDDLDGPLAARASSSSGSVSAASNIDGMDALIGATPQASNPSASAQSPPTTGFICPSEVMYGKPKLAKNKKGLWKVIVNAGEFTQTVRLEKCLLPNKKCNYVSAQSYESRCAQVHSYHRLLVFEKGRGFYIDTFRLPTGCNCHVTKKSFVSSTSGNGRRDSSSSDSQARQQQPVDSGVSLAVGGGSSAQFGGRASERSSSESMLSQTLWSILSGGGGGPGANGGANNNGASGYRLDASGANMGQSDSAGYDRPAQREAYQSQSLILEHLSQNPALAANISDSVLRQLIDVGQSSGLGGGSNGHYQHQQLARQAAKQQQAYYQGGDQLAPQAIGAPSSAGGEAHSLAGPPLACVNTC